MGWSDGAGEPIPTPGERPPPPPHLRNVEYLLPTSRLPAGRAHASPDVVPTGRSGVWQRVKDITHADVNVTFDLLVPHQVTRPTAAPIPAKMLKLAIDYLRSQHLFIRMLYWFSPADSWTTAIRGCFNCVCERVCAGGGGSASVLHMALAAPRSLLIRLTRCSRPHHPPPPPSPTPLHLPPAGGRAELLFFRACHPLAAPAPTPSLTFSLR